MERTHKEVFRMEQKGKYSRKLLELHKERIIECANELKGNYDKQWKVNCLYIELGALQKMLWWEIIYLSIDTREMVEDKLQDVLNIIDLNLNA